LDIESEATFEQFPYILMAGVRSTTPTGTTTAKTWLFEFGTSAQRTVKTYTVEAGDDQQEEEMAYSFVSAFKIAGSVDEAVKMSATWQGRQVAPSTKTPSLALVDVEEILTNKMTLCINATGGSIGGTPVSSTLLSFALSASPAGMQAIQAADGALYFSTLKNVQPEVMLELTFEHNTSAVAEIAAWRAQATRLIRLRGEGSAVTGAANRRLTIDIAGKWEKFTKIGEQDGNDVVTGTLRGRWSDADNLFCSIEVVNALATLP